MRLTEYRALKRREAAALYAKDRRAQMAEARVPDARAVASALLALMLDAYVASGRNGAPPELLDRLVEHGYHRGGAEDAIGGMVERHLMLTQTIAEADAA